MVLYLTFGTQLYYFQVDDQALVVRNHFYLWYSRKFSLVDMRSVAVENPRPGMVALNLTKKDFEAVRFPADSLRKTHWKALVHKLSGKDIPVIDEAYS